MADGPGSAVEVVFPDDPALTEILERHPHARLVSGNSEPGLQFRQGKWDREIRIADVQCESYGLIEVMDNNPLVCADVASVPSAAGTLALIALGPLIRSGIVLEAPTITTNVPDEESDIEGALATEGWQGGVVLDVLEQDLEGVYAGTVIAMIRTPKDLSEIDEVYRERYSRSFYVRPIDSGEEWHVRMVKGTPNAVYRIRLAAEEKASLLTVQVMADRDGKCGAAQIVHMFNVMCGFEESLGIGG